MQTVEREVLLYVPDYSIDLVPDCVWPIHAISVEHIIHKHVRRRVYYVTLGLTLNPYVHIL